MSDGVRAREQRRWGRDRTSVHCPFGGHIHPRACLIDSGTVGVSAASTVSQTHYVFSGVAFSQRLSNGDAILGTH